MIDACKTQVKRLARRLGLGRETGIILAYHRVADLPEDPFRLAVAPEWFRAQMQELQRACRVLSLMEMHQRAQSGTLPRRAVAVTFDDGYADNLHHALPILRDLDIPATVFVTAGMIGAEREFWWDALARLTPDWRKHHARLRTLEPAARDLALRQMFQAAGISEQARPTHRALNLNELRELDRSPLIEIGGHTLHHPQLSALSIAQQKIEIAGGKHQLETILGRTLTSFSYPFGGPNDFTPETRALVAGSGFICACANYPGSVSADSEAMSLPRHLVRNWNAATFARNLERMFLEEPVPEDAPTTAAA